MSNSKTWKNKKNELKQKEELLLSDLDISGKKVKKIALWSLGVGIISLIGYGIYRSFSEPRPKKKKHKKVKVKVAPKDSPVVDSAIEYLGPTLGNWLLKQLKK